MRQGISFRVIVVHRLCRRRTSAYGEVDSMRILLADDHRIVREGVRTLLERAGFEVVAEAEDGRAAIHLAQIHRPDVAVLDLVMPGLGGIECARELLAINPKILVVLLTVFPDEHQVVAALHAGVRGYVVKTQAATELVDAIKQVRTGSFYMGTKMSHVLASLYFAGGMVPEALTPRLRETLRLIGEGTSTREIASILGVSQNTAKLYRSRLMAKLDIHDTAGLVRYAIRRGLVAL
jgi:DNA-binding NarL/FixJ family response regulator